MPIQISCVVLSYNGGDSLIRTLESCKLQTYPYKDLVIADDASTDNGYTVSVIEKWLDENSKYFTNVLFVKNISNLGIVKNLRNASLQAYGDIIFTLGQGDTVYGPDTFINIAQKIDSYPRNYPLPLVWFGYFKSFSLIPSWHIVEHRLSQPFHFRVMRQNPQKALRWLACVDYIGAPSMVYNKKYFSDKVFPLPESVTNIEDYSMLLWLLSQNSSNKLFDILPFFIRWYEVGVGISSNPSQIMRERFLHSLRCVCDWAIQTLNIRNDIINTLHQQQTYIQQKNKIAKLINCPLYFIKLNILRFYFKMYYHLISKRILCKLTQTSISFSESLFSRRSQDL